MIFDRLRLTKKESEREQDDHKKIIYAKRFIYVVFDSDVCEDDEDAGGDDSFGHIPIA